MSWSLDRASAFASIERLYSRSSGPQHTSDLRTTFRDAACALSLSGRDQVIQRDADDFIEQGLCQVDKVDGKTITGRLSEPIVVEAAVHYYGLHSHVTANMSRAASGSQAGTAFERFMLPYIKRGFSEVRSSRRQLRERGSSRSRWGAARTASSPARALSRPIPYSGWRRRSRHASTGRWSLSASRTSCSGQTSCSSCGTPATCSTSCRCCRRPSSRAT